MEMENQDSQGNYDTESKGSKRTAFSGPLVSSKRSSARDENPYIEITLDVGDESVTVQNICATPDQEAALLASRLEKRPSLGSQVSLKLRQVSRELRSITSSKRTTEVDHSRSGASRALLGLRFMNKNVGNDGWSEVVARFNHFSVDGMLPKSRFAQCIGKFIIIEFVFFFLLPSAKYFGIGSSPFEFPTFS